MHSLDATSESYRSEIDHYATFAAAEDAPTLVYQSFLPYVQNRDILDCGCGSGKYLALFAPHARSIVGVEQASGCLELSTAVANRYPNVRVISTCASTLPLPDTSIDCVYATWMLSTIIDPTLRDKVVQEWHRVLRPGGHILLAENAQGSEFEQMRGRAPRDLRTTQYNETLTNHYGFLLGHTLNSWIQFSSPSDLTTTISGIWGPQALATLPAHSHETSRIHHTIHVYIKGGTAQYPDSLAPSNPTVGTPH